MQLREFCVTRTPGTPYVHRNPIGHVPPNAVAIALRLAAARQAVEFAQIDFCAGWSQIAEIEGRVASAAAARTGVASRFPGSSDVWQSERIKARPAIRLWT